MRQLDPLVEILNPTFNILVSNKFLFSQIITELKHTLLNIHWTQIKLIIHDRSSDK